MEDEGDTRDLFISVVGWSARQESNRKSERNKAAHVRMVAEGKWGRGKPPLGYQRDGDGKLAVDPGEAKIVEFIYELYISNRMGVRHIKKELEHRGVRTRRGGTFWTPSVIERILKDPVYKGRHSSGVPAPVIVDTERWQVAQERRISNHNLKTGYVHRYALQGRAVCECGGRIRVEHPGRGRGKAVYFCNNRYENSYRVMKGGERCVVPRRRVEEVELELHRELAECMKDPEKLGVMVERSIARIEDELSSMSGDFTVIKVDLEQVIEDIGRVEESWLRRRVDTRRRDNLIGELETRRDSLEARLEEMSPERRQSLEDKQELLRGAREYLKSLKERAEIGIPSWRFSPPLAWAESDASHKFRESQYYAFSWDADGIPEILDRILTEFSMTAVFREDRVDIIGGIELEILNSDAHPHASLLGGS